MTTVISFDADGDSREMNTMLLFSHLFFNLTKAQYLVFHLTKLLLQRNDIHGLPLKFVMVFHLCKLRIVH